MGVDSALLIADRLMNLNIKKNPIFAWMTPERSERLNNVLSKRQSDLTIVLENVTDPHNIAAVMRTCDAVGIQDIYILNTTVPNQQKWAAKSSSSASKWLSIHQFNDIENCFAELRKHYSKIFTTHLGAGAVELYKLDLTEPVALVFGNEHSGISEDLIRHSDGNFIIPQVGIIKSLNISVACAVSLYEAYRQKSLAGHYETPKFTGGKLTEIKKHWGFLDEE